MKNRLLCKCLALFAIPGNKKNTTRFNGLFALFLMVMGMGVSWGQTNNYFGTSGTLSSNVWSTNSAGPFTSALVTTNGPILNFNNTGSATNATIATCVGINFGAVITWTAAGNIGAAGVNLPINVSSGINQDFGSSQSFSTSSTAALTKNGSGSLALTGSTFAGGFTLNAGTLVVRGVNSMGNGALILNGGTVCANSNKDLSGKFTSITFGGDVQFGEVTTNVPLAASASNITFSNNMALGSFNRTFTLGGSGTMTFGGIISNLGSNGLTFTANSNGTGRFDITGTNTFTGPVNINGNGTGVAEVRFTADGSIGNSTNTITIDGGRFGIVSGGTVTIASTRNIAVGSTTGTSITAPGSNGALTYNGVIADKSGSTGILSKQGSGILSLGGFSTYTGATSINNGTIQLTTGDDRLPTGTVLSLGQAASANLGIFDLNGRNQTIGGLATNSGTGTSGTNTVTSVSSATLTISGSSSNTYGSTSVANNGLISGALSIVKSGNGTQTFGGSTNYTYTGTTTISGGKIELGNANIIPATQVILDGGTFSTGATTGFTETVGTLNLNTTGTIALGTGSHTLTFSASNGVTWAGTALTVTGWTGTAGATGTAGKIFIGSSNSGLTASQLALITFSGYTGVTATILSTGEIVPDVSVSTTISAVGTLSAVNTTYGSASTTPTTFTASGTNLTTDIDITAPSGYEISQTSGGTSGYATTQTLTQSGGTVSSTTIYVRLTSTAIPNSYSGNVALTSTGATSVNVATTSSTVTAKALTITGLTADSRTYDGTTGAAFTGTPALSGVVNSDVVSITGSGTASFVTKTVGTTKVVNVTGYGLTGANASNYSLTQPTLSANINAATLTVASGATVSNKIYDGTTDAVVSVGTLSAGILNPDVVSISTTGIFANANVNTGISVDLVLTGEDAGNYSLTQPSRTADITKASQTITFGALASKTLASADFAPGATSPTSGTNAISYVSSNLSVATIVSNQIHIVGAGTTNITASQAASSNYNAAADVVQSLIVTAAPVNIAIQDFETSPATPTWNYAGGGTFDNTASRFNGARSYQLPTSTTMTTDNLDISNYTNVVVSVAYAATGVDSGEDLFIEVSYDNGSTWVGTGSAQLVDGSSNANVNINSLNGLRTPTNANPYTFNVSASETQVRLRFSQTGTISTGEFFWIDDVKVTGVLNTSPRIIRTPSSLSGFSQNSSTPSSEQTYTVSGNNLTASVSIAPPTGFEISTTTGGSFSATNPIVLSQSGGDLVNEPVTIYVRQSSSSLGAVSGNIVHTSTSATDVNTALSGSRTGTYYYAGSGNLDVLTNWGINTNGTGSNPSNFTSDDIIYEIRNAATATIGANWTVSGTSSKVVIGDGTNATDFTIPSGFSLTGTVDISNAAELTIENTSPPTFGTFATNSTLEYNNLNVTLSTATTYRNLKLTGNGTKTFPGGTVTITGNLILKETILDGGSGPFSTILLAGDLTYIGTLTPPVDANSITLSTNGTAAGTQTFTGAGNTLRWFRINTTTANTIVLSNSGGSSNFYAGNNAGGGITLLNGSILNMNGNDFQLFNNASTTPAFVMTTGTISTTTSSDFIIERTASGALGTLRFTTGANSIGNLTLNHTGATNTLTIGNELNVNGVITVTDGTLASGGYINLKSNTTSTASIAAIGTGGAITGNVTVERYIPGKRAWRALTAPVIGSTANSIYANWQNGGIYSAGTGVELWSSTGGNGMGTGPSNSVLQYNNTGTTGAWNAITNTNENLFDANGNKAFMVFVTGPYYTSNTNVAAGFANTTLRATGQLITGTKTYANLPSGVHTLIGNPYACPMSPLLLLNGNTSFGPNLWVWDANTTVNNGVGAYNTYDKTTNKYTNITNSDQLATTPDIQSGQAFFVKASTGTATLSISESYKSSGTSTYSFLRTSSLPELLRVGLYKQVNNEWSGRDGAMTVILSNVDANQASNKMANGTENIAFTKNGASFASNHHLPLIASDVLNVKVWNTTAGANYKLKINTEEFSATNLSATLEDLFTNARTPLTLDGSAVEYPFTVTTEALSTGDRFRIVFQPSLLGNNIPKSDGFSIVPNPVTGDSFQVNLGSLATGTYSYSICNTLGQEVEKGSINNATQNTNYEVKMNNSATGIYIMKIKGNDNSVFTAKIIKK